MEGKQLQNQEAKPELMIAQFKNMTEVLAKFPENRYNLVLPLRAPRTPEQYEIWATTIFITPKDCAKIGRTGNYMPLKHKLYELAREAGVIVRSVEQVLPSTWKNIVEFAKELNRLPQERIPSIEWVRHELSDLLHHRRNDVAVKAVVAMEVAPGEWVQAIGHAEWIEEDEKALIERAVRREAAKEGWDEERVQREIENAMIDARRFRLRVAETKALLRAIRAILSLKTSYTLEELSKPFVIVSWRRILSPVDLEERWREVFGEPTERQTIKVVEVTEGDNGGETIDTETVVTDED